MLIDLLSYSGITTKIRAMESNLLTDNDFREFVGLRSVTEAAAFLKSKPAYKELFADVDETRIHRGQIERLLNISSFTDFTKIYRFANSKQREFLHLYFLHYEVSLLKTCMRSVLNGSFDLPYRDVVTEFLKRYSSIDIDSLASAHTIEEFIACLKGTEYYKPLSKLLDLTEPTLFDYEMTLDLYYFSHLWELSHEFLSGKELKSLSEAYGTKIDMLNLQWIYRSKKYYNMSAADIYALLIPVSYKLKKQDIVHLVESANMEDFNMNLANTRYAKAVLPDAFSGESLEHFYVTLVEKVTYISARKNPYSVAMLNMYLTRKEHEVRKITTALECIRYGLEASETVKYININ
ncbi:V0D/AC39 family V-type ATPase subunit [Konateibacter massiliensis]|uniref:V0D/AC39 family V-type ATPase subunit n=1 Tax=Konateibacter massiliensis TaxID=2002841 RepID=UPI000C1603AB|nr:V-type ATPase subunit [Konateibacter massiliensis]